MTAAADDGLPDDATIRWLADNDPVLLGRVEALLQAALLSPEERQQRAMDLRSDLYRNEFPDATRPEELARRLAATPQRAALPGHRIAWQWRLFGFAGRWLILTPARRRHLEAERGGRQEPRLGRW